MRYFGSKASVAHMLYSYASERTRFRTICDPFGGIGVVGAYFKAKGHEVTTGDHLYAANCFQTAVVAMERRPSFSRVRAAVGLTTTEELVDYLNRCKNDGWFVREYAERRRFFKRSNAIRIDGCRRAIYAWERAGLLSDAERKVLIASLIASMDRVANTAGTYYAYLKTWYRKALQPFEFALLPPTKGDHKCQAILSDARDLVAHRKFDVLYLDPPYNHRSYGRYYHLPETIARLQTPRVYGSSGSPNQDYPYSAFNHRTTALDALADLLDAASFKYLLFHYCDDGLIDQKDLRSLLAQYGHLQRRNLTALGYSTKRGESRRAPHVLYGIWHG
jgi:adenine-specific DNA-methyltransferase